MTALSLGERVSHSGVFISRSATGEGFFAELLRYGSTLRSQEELVTGCEFSVGTVTVRRE